MTDQNSQFFAILTAVGEAKQANADALGIPWTFSEMAVGDANGTDPIPDRLQTELINEWRRSPLNQLWVDPKDPNVIVAEQIIPAEVGGRWIREVGLYDAAGDLVAVANCPPSYKPLLSQGSGRTQTVRMNLIVSGTTNIELKIDPSVVLATRAYVDQRVIDEVAKLDGKQSVRAVSTCNIVLSAPQNIDGVAIVAGDRVLVAGQTAARNNGLWVAGSAAWSRATDADISAKVTPGMLVTVEEGSAHADSLWQLTTNAPITLGATELVFEAVGNSKATPGPSARMRNIVNTAGPSSAGFVDDCVVVTTATGKTYRILDFSAAVNIIKIGIGGMDVSAAGIINRFVLVYAAYNPISKAYGVFGTLDSAEHLQLANQPGCNSRYLGAHAPAGYTATALIGVIVISPTPGKLNQCTQVGRKVKTSPYGIISGITCPTTRQWGAITSTSIPFAAVSVDGYISMTSNYSSGSMNLTGTVAPIADGPGGAYLIEFGYTGLCSENQMFSEVPVHNPRGLSYAFTNSVSPSADVLWAVLVNGFNF